MINFSFKLFEKWTLTKKLSAIIGLLVFFLPLLLSLFVINQSEKVLNQELKMRGDALVHKLVFLSTDFILHNDIEGLYKLTNNMVRVEEGTKNIIVYAMILDNSGKPMAVADPFSIMPGSSFKMMNDPDINNNRGTLIEDIKAKDSDYYNVTSLISNGKEKIGIARIGITKKYYREEIAWLKINAFFFSIMTGSLGLVVGWFLSRHITNPLSQLTKSIEKLDYESFNEDIKLSPMRHDEIGLLADSFNRIMQRWRENRDKLKESEEIYISSWEQAEDPRLRITPGKKIVAINKKVEELLNYSREEILGSDIYSIIPDEYHQFIDVIFQHALRDEKADTAEIEVLTQDKRSISMEIDMRGVVMNKMVRFVQIHLRDVSRRKEIEQELINSARFTTIGELTAELTHEINNPLGIILGFAQELLTETDKDHSDYKCIKIIAEEAKRCKNVMKHLLAFARPPSFKYSVVDLDSLIKDSFELVSLIIDKRGISVKKDIPANLPKLHIDDSQIKAVLINIYNNAIDAMPQGGDLTISASLESPYVKLTISDTGKGIKEDDMNKVFMPYFTTKEGGTGIGLDISKRIIEAHKGQLTVESCFGKGTNFIILLPAEGLDDKDKEHRTEHK